MLAWSLYGGYFLPSGQLCALAQRVSCASPVTQETGIHAIKRINTNGCLLVHTPVDFSHTTVHRGVVNIDICEEYRGDGMTLSRPWIACLKLATGLVVHKLRGNICGHGTIRLVESNSQNPLPAGMAYHSDTGLVVIRELFNSVWNSIEENL
jgi:hypothetical protein